jgi:NADH:ubiquinone oxidoreductase subunit 6 (subunit J)
MSVFAAFVWGLFAFAVAMDAARRGHHARFWLVLTFVTGVFGLAAYVVVVLTSGNESDAPDDEAEVRETVRVCPDCSARAPDSQ